MGRFDDVYNAAMQDPAAFWGRAAEEIHWIEKWDRVLDDRDAPWYRWFAGGVMNTCYNAVDRHVKDGRGDQAAIIYDSPVTDTVSHMSYRELQDVVAKTAGALAARGVAKGDRVIIYMPMVPQALVAMLACARLGAIHSVVFGGFAANELAARMDHVLPHRIWSPCCVFHTAFSDMAASKAWQALSSASASCNTAGPRGVVKRLATRCGRFLTNSSAPRPLATPNGTEYFSSPPSA